jgi:phosphopantetheine adenylyltransferase
VSERVDLLVRATAHLSNVTCASDDGLTMDAARAHGASAIVRSAHEQLGDELTMAATNEAVGRVGTTVRPAGSRDDVDLVTDRGAMPLRGEADEACALVPLLVAE